MSRRWPRHLYALLATVPAIGVGCSGPRPLPELYPLTGTVTRDGHPVKGGGLLFTAESGEHAGLVMNAMVRDDGTFAAQTMQPGDAGSVIKPGIPAGTYRVTYQPMTEGDRPRPGEVLEERVTVEPKENTAAITLPVRKVEDPAGPK